MVARYGPERITELPEEFKYARHGAFVKFTAWQKAHMLIKRMEVKMEVLEMANAELRARLAEFESVEKSTKT